MTTIDLKGERYDIDVEQTKYIYSNFTTIKLGNTEIQIDIKDAKELQDQLEKVFYPSETREDLQARIEELEQQLEEKTVKGAA